MTRAAPALARLAFLLTALLLAALAGCKSAPPPKPPPPPTIVQATLSAEAGLNPDLRGRPSPVVVRVFELKSAAAFGSADFFSLWDREKETLGEDLVARDEFLLRPGENRKFERTLAPQTVQLGVLAAYRDLERARWRAVQAIVPNTTQPLAVVLGARGVSIEAPKP